MRAHTLGALLPALVALAGAGCGSGTSSTAPGTPFASNAMTTAADRGPGSLDPAFGNRGKALVPIDSEPVATITTRDEGIVVLGNAGSGGSAQVVRLLPSGRLDKRFGTGGVVALQMFAAYSLATAPGDGLIVGGVANDETHAELVRLRSDGSLDSTFGSGGIVEFNYRAGTTNGTFVTILQPNGDLIAGGFAASLESDVDLTSLARFDSKGSFDSSFGSSGVVSLDLVGAVTAIGLQPNGDILVCGGPFGSSASLLARFLPNGAVDRTKKGGTLLSFAHTGSLTFDGANAFDSRGRLLRWTSSPASSGEYASVSRVLRNERPDPRFRGTPFAFDSPLTNVPHDLEIAANGTLLIAGEGADSGGRRVFGVARLLRDGTLDPSFGTSGRVVTPFEYAARADALNAARDGKIVVAGVAISSRGSLSLAVARYLAK